MSILRILVLAALGAATSLRANSPAEQNVAQAIKSPDLSIVHLWAPWCSNCQAELKNGGWLKMVKDNPRVTFYFVSVWNDGGDGKSMINPMSLFWPIPARATATTKSNNLPGCRSRGSRQPGSIKEAIFATRSTTAKFILTCFSNLLKTANRNGRIRANPSCLNDGGNDFSQWRKS